MLAMSHPRKLVSVLYKKRKFAHRQRTSVSKTEVHSFLSGSFPDTRGSWPINTYVLFSTQQYSTILYNTLNYAIVSRHQINTCTVLYSYVLYCIKIRKFAHRQRIWKERTFQTLKSTLRGSWPIIYRCTGTNKEHTTHKVCKILNKGLCR